MFPRNNRNVFGIQPMTFILTCHNAEVYLNTSDCCCKYWSGKDEFSCYSLFGEGKMGSKRLLAKPVRINVYFFFFFNLKLNASSARSGRVLT